MTSSWGTAWARAWGNSWGLLVSQAVGGGGGQGWVLQQFAKRPWEMLEEVKVIYQELKVKEPTIVAQIVAPFRKESQINWGAFLKDMEAVKQIFILKQQIEEDEEEELLTILMAY